MLLWWRYSTCDTPSSADIFIILNNMAGGERATKLGHALAKGLGIKVAYRDPLGPAADPVTRGESTFSVGTVDTYSYTEPEPTSIEWIREITPSGQQVLNYLISLFPFLNWISRYNVQWLIGDLVAGKSATATPKFTLFPRVRS